MLPETAVAAEDFSEAWHLVKSTDGSGGWLVASIQQVQ
jgi:predicted lipid-binding transport protein (Tim44 family)